MVGEKPGAFGRCALRGGDLGSVGRRAQLGQAIVPGRCHRQAADNGDNAIELEGAKRWGVHEPNR